MTNEVVGSTKLIDLKVSSFVIRVIVHQFTKQIILVLIWSVGLFFKHIMLQPRSFFTLGCC